MHSAHKRIVESLCMEDGDETVARLSVTFNSNFFLWGRRCMCVENVIVQRQSGAHAGDDVLHRGTSTNEITLSDLATVLCA